MLGLIALVSAGNPWVAEPLLSLSRAGVAGVTISPASNAPRTDDLSPAFLRQLSVASNIFIKPGPGCDGSDICVPIPFFTPTFGVCDGSDICDPICDGSDICDPFPVGVPGVFAPSPPPIIAATDAYGASKPQESTSDGNVAAYWMIPIAGVIVGVIILAAFGFLAPAAATTGASATATTASKTPEIGSVSTTADVVEKAPVPITDIEIVSAK